MELVLAAIVTGCFGLLAEGSRRSRKSIDALTRKIQTNHGLEPFEYLEMIAEVKSGQEKVVDLIAQHTVQDAVNFKTIEHRLERIEVTLAD